MGGAFVLVLPLLWSHSWCSLIWTTYLTQFKYFCASCRFPFSCRIPHVWFVEFDDSTDLDRLHPIIIQWVGVHRSVWICWMLLHDMAEQLLGEQTVTKNFHRFWQFDISASGHGRAFALPHWIWSGSAAALDLSEIHSGGKRTWGLFSATGSDVESLKDFFDYINIDSFGSLNGDPKWLIAPASRLYRWHFALACCRIR